MDERESENQEEERPRRPRVVDKRISSRRSSEASPSSDQTPPPQDAPKGPSTPPPEPSAPTSVETPAEPPQQPGAPAAPPPGEEPLWTPEQEAQVRQMAEEMARVPSLEWVVNFAVNLANVAGVKLQARDLPDAQLAIDALASLLQGTAGRLGDAETPLRQTLAQLQMAYAQTVSPPPPAGGTGSP